jgi:Icc-related predicted phosphoesterase
MRLIASADLHGFLDVYRWLAARTLEYRADALVLAGDLLSPEDDFASLEEAMAARASAVEIVLNDLECPVLYIMGNDDLIDWAPDRNSLISIHNRRVDLCGHGFVGYQNGPPFMGGPHERDAALLAEEIASLSPLLDERSVLVTHYPAQGILSGEYGLEPIRKLVDEAPFLIHIHGHSHSRFGCQTRHFNVASAGQKRAMLIDLRTLACRVLTEP